MRPAKKEKSIFSKQVIMLRTARGMTQKQLAAALGVSINTIAYFEISAAFRLKYYMLNYRKKRLH